MKMKAYGGWEGESKVNSQYTSNSSLSSEVLKIIQNFTEVMSIHLLLRGGMLFTLCIYHLAQLNNLDDSTVEQTMTQFNHLEGPTLEKTMIPSLRNESHVVIGYHLLCVDISTNPT